MPELELTDTERRELTQVLAEGNEAVRRGEAQVMSIDEMMTGASNSSSNKP